MEINIYQDIDENQKLLINNNKNDEKNDSIFLNRYFALALMGFSLLGQNFVVDNPAGMDQNIIYFL
jgi:hypothetical protein